ncbi:hypothetical protein SD37_16805 [Amycolatopsis orientalis]|uniref:Uncharacterized protein n=1 Tax=Amycolatopsis orientalis TaxID=31958 RepID=A0A193BY34_AMYOR|nr:Gfo/Idh/MocA family oxidoreductase [Amycolatopsis orientalis]ANN17137.1 hypothetical protein SD37_16805 [Amycolatopsis orientalis]
MRIRVGLLGYGWGNRTVWAPRLQAHPRTTVAAVYDPAAPPGTGRLCGSLGEFFANGLDLVVVGTPNRTHVELACAALDRRIPVVVEKPLCLGEDELQMLSARARERETGVLVSRCAIRRPDVRRLAASLPAGPLSVEASWLRADGTPRPGSWFTSRAEAGGGALLDLGWHLADAALGLLGYPRPVAVEAELTGAGTTPPPAAGWRADPVSGPGVVDVELDGTLRARFEGGSELVLRAAWRSESTVDATRLAVAQGDRGWELTTTFGFSPNRVTGPELVLSTVEGVERIPVPHEIGAEYDAQLAAMVDFADARLDWAAELEETAAVVALLDAAYRAADRPLAAVR